MHSTSQQDRASGLGLARQLGQLGEVGRHAPRLIPGEQVGGGTSSRLLFEIDIGQGLTVLVAHDEAGVVGLIDSPGWREAALSEEVDFGELRHSLGRSCARERRSGISLAARGQYSGPFYTRSEIHIAVLIL